MKTLHRWDESGKLKAKRTPSNQESLSPQQELVEDMLAIIHCFSCRIYGSITYAKEKTKALSDILNIPRQTRLTLSKSIQG